MDNSFISVHQLLPLIISEPLSMQSTAEHIDYKALYEQLKEEANITIPSLKLQLEQLKNGLRQQA